MIWFVIFNIVHYESNQADTDPPSLERQHLYKPISWRSANIKDNFQSGHLEKLTRAGVTLQVQDQCMMMINVNIHDI